MNLGAAVTRWKLTAWWLSAVAAAVFLSAWVTW